jgi:hypothetical protein
MVNSSHTTFPIRAWSSIDATAGIDWIVGAIWGNVWLADNGQANSRRVLVSHPNWIHFFSLFIWTRNIFKAVSCGEPPELPNTQVSFNSTSFGGKAVYQCDKGFVSDNDYMHLECSSNGQWSETLPKCTGAWSTRSTVDSLQCLLFFPWFEERNCSLNSNEIVANGFMKSTSESSLSERVFSVGTQIDFECEANYEMIGSKTVRCLKSGQWDSYLPVCILSEFRLVARTSTQEIFILVWKDIYCPSPEIPDHSLVTTTNIKTEKGYPYKTVIEFTCLDGYSMYGLNRQICAEDAQWTVSNTSCVKITTTTLTPTTTNLVKLINDLIAPVGDPLKPNDATDSNLNCLLVDLLDNKNMVLDNSSFNNDLAILKNDDFVYYTCKTSSNSYSYKAYCLNGSLSFEERCEDVQGWNCFTLFTELDHAK